MRPHSRNIHRHRSRETVSALDERAPRSRPLADVAPRLRGLSVAGLSGGLVFTWSATADTFAALDACQYLTGGPCVQAAATGEPVHASPKTLLAGGRWELFATAAAAAGGRSDVVASGAGPSQ